MDKNNGVLENEEMFDSIISDINNSMRCLILGQYIAFCDSMHQTAYKLSLLKKGVTNDLAHKDEVIEDLKNQLRLCGADLKEVTPQQFLEDLTKDGAE